jgi:hypothetical protein
MTMAEKVLDHEDTRTHLTPAPAFRREHVDAIERLASHRRAREMQFVIQEPSDRPKSRLKISQRIDISNES